MHENPNPLTSASPDLPNPPSAGETGIESTLYLQLLGRRVREARARRGMSRRILSRDSNVSERYLAQLESGHGNISILLLRQIVKALDLPVYELLHDGPEQSGELRNTVQFLEKLPPAKISHAREILLREFAASDSAARRQRIAIVGLRGAGKSTLGSLVAKHLGMPFLELDRVIEERSGLGLSIIFDLYGQSGFRRLERECLDHVLQSYPAFVLATGGSLVSEAATYERLLAECFTIWLRATPEDHMQRVIAQGDTRPMSENRGAAMSELKSILSVREPLYRRADATLETSFKSQQEAFQELVRATPTQSNLGSVEEHRSK